MNFATEQDRVKALEGLDETPSNLTKLEEIRSATIGAEPAKITPEVTETAKPIEEKKPEGISGEVFTVSKKDLPEGYDSIGKVFKSLKESQELIARQQGFIREKLGESTAHTPQVTEAIARAEKAEAELAALKGSATPQQGTTVDIATVQAEIARIEQMQTELDTQADKDPDIAFTGEYQKKVRELSRMQTKNLNLLTTLYNKAQTEIRETRSVADGYVQSSKQNEEEKAGKKARQSLYDEITSVDVPELKLSKKAEEVEGEYVKWRADIALAYFGRPAQTTAELFTALGQLQLKNPDLLAKCQIAGIKADPTDDVRRYISLCEMLDYQLGYRKDPVTGQTMRLMKQDPVTGQQIPLVLPSLKAAIQQKRLEEGHYEKQRDGAFQQGAQSVAEAAARRDQGAVELDTHGDQGQTVNDGKWAVDVLTDTNAEEEAMKAYRKGDKVPMEKIQKARKLLNMPPISFDEA
jgi:hypothetical protein